MAEAPGHFSDDDDETDYQHPAPPLPPMPLPPLGPLPPPPDQEAPAELPADFLDRFPIQNLFDHDYNIQQLQELLGSDSDSDEDEPDSDENSEDEYHPNEEPRQTEPPVLHSSQIEAAPPVNLDAIRVLGSPRSRPRRQIAVEDLSDKAMCADDSDDEHETRSADVVRVILDYLVGEGYRDAALRLCQDIGVQLSDKEMALLDARMAIREDVLNGRILSAIDRLEQLCPGLMKANIDIFFYLHQLQLLEIIKSGDVDAAVLYSEEHLTNSSETFKEQHLDCLEKTMALLIYDDINKAPYSSISNKQHRHRIISIINEGILGFLSRNERTTSGGSTTSAIHGIEMLMRMSVWARCQVSNSTQEDIINELFEDDRGHDDVNDILLT